MASHDWLGKVGNPAQLGGIETSVLDNGPGKGVRIAWVNTGSGLRFKVVLDRAMDIAEAFFNQHSLAWISHMGVTAPDTSAVSGLNWLHSFGGGLLTTCGLSHVGGPEKDSYGERGLHDRISNLRASLESVVQPDLSCAEPEMSITGTVLQSTVFGPHLQLRRTISAKLGQPSIFIRDKVTNLGNIPASHMLLYHVNFGWPLVDEGVEMIWKGSWKSRSGEKDYEIFRDGSDFRYGKPPLPSHRGSGEAVAFINPDADKDGFCEASVHNKKIGLKTTLRFKKEQLPWLINWQHWGENEYVSALEPATHPPVGQAAARADQTLIMLNPGETREYAIDLGLSSP
jgi:hypothetical protein